MVQKYLISDRFVLLDCFAGGFKFGGLRLQGHPDGSSVSTIFEDLFIEEGTGA